MHPAEWEVFRAGLSQSAAENLVRFLEASDVPCLAESRALAEALESSFCVLVAADLAHRARWAAAQLVPTDDELLFLATGELPGRDGG